MERLDFSDAGVDYILTIHPVGEELFNIVVREKDSGLYVKSWTGRDEDYVTKIKNSAITGKHLVLKRDLNAYRVLEFIEQYIGQHGRTPRIRDIAQGINFEQSLVNMSVNQLIDMGFLRRVPYVPRGLTLNKRRVDA